MIVVGDEPEDSRRAMAKAMAGRRELFPAEVPVVGSRGHGALAGMVLGPVSQAVPHVVPCPVAVVRTR